MRILKVPLCVTRQGAVGEHSAKKDGATSENTKNFSGNDKFTMSGDVGLANRIERHLGKRGTTVRAKRIAEDLGAATSGGHRRTLNSISNNNPKL